MQTFIETIIETFVRTIVWVIIEVIVEAIVEAFVETILKLPNIVLRVSRVLSRASIELRAEPRAELR